MKTILFKSKLILLLAIGSLLAFSFSNIAYCQGSKKILYDIDHGQNSRNAKIFEELIQDSNNFSIEVQEKGIAEKNLKGIDLLILFAPTLKLQKAEKSDIVNYLQTGGSLLLIFDEERRTSMSEVEINDLIVPFGLELTDDTPARHNCGAKAEKGDVCKEVRELPYSGGRSIKGGTVISRVYDEGDFIHSAYIKTKAGGKIIVMSDGMAGLLMGKPDGVRFSGTNPSDSKYWGKDSRVFMQEVFSFLLN